MGYSRLLALVVARGSKGLFPVRVREQIAGNPALIAIIEPLLAVWYAIREQVTMLDRQMLARARNDHVAQRLMTIPGVGVVIARAYAAVIEGDRVLGLRRHRQHRFLLPPGWSTRAIGEGVIGGDRLFNAAYTPYGLYGSATRESRDLLGL